MKRLMLVSFFLVFICSCAYAENEGGEGYDENTEISVKGVVTGTLPRMRGPVIIVVKAGNREYRVITGPQRYILQEGFEFRVGELLLITGSKFIGRDGYMNVIARRIRNISSGRTLLLRDSLLIPLWRGPNRMGPPNKEPHHINPHMMRDRD